MKRFVALSLAIILLASNNITAAEGEPELFAISEPEFACGTDQEDLYEAHNTLVQQKIAELQEDFGVQQESIQEDAGATLLGLMPNFGDGTATLMRSTGTVKLLVIPIVYSDQAKYKENFDMEVQYKQFFAPYDNTTNVYLQSVHGYYQRLSYDKLNIIGDVMEPFEASYTSNYYYTSDTAQTYERRRDLLAEALQFYIDQGVDLSQYDTDGDGMLDAVLVKSMCPNRTHYTMAFTDPVEVEDYQAGPFVFMSLTLTDKENEATGLTQQVAEHEIGHLMGLLDNYNSNGTTNCFDRELGELMEASQIYSGYINAYYKYLLGWIDPLIVTGEDAVTDLSLFPVESTSDDGTNSPKAIVLIPNVNAFPFTEFYIAEYRGGGMYPYASKPAFDKAPGLVIWHANTFLSANEQKNYKNKTNYLQPIYKSGTEKYDTKDIYIAGDQFSAATTPNSVFYDGTYTGIYLEITQITPEKACIRAGFDPVNLLPEPVIEVSLPSKRVISKGEKATIVITTKVGDELLSLDADTARKLYGCSTSGTVTGAGTVSWSALKNPMTVTIEGEGGYTASDGSIWVDIPAGAIRYNGKDSAAVTSEKIYIDNTPPEITLLGANPQTIWIGDSYQDVGAVATDNLDSDIDKKLVVDASEVKTDIPGTYRVLYSVTDHAGHTATAERSVVVKEQPHSHSYSNDWYYGETSHWHECECGDRGEEAPHTENSGTVAKEPTLEEVGVKTYACSVCGYIMRTETLPKLEPEHTHSYGEEWKRDKDSHWHECACGEKDGQAAHTEDSGMVTKEPTLEAEGVKTFSCFTCGYIMRTETLPKLEPEHTHSYGEEWKTDKDNHWHECECGDRGEETAHTPVPAPAVAATCTADGKTEGSHCSVCDYVITAQTTVSATGHSWDQGSITTAPTCTEKGIKTFFCATCASTRTEDVDSVGHSYSTDWLSDAGNHWHKCENCDATSDTAAHTYGKWATTKVPTTTAKGSEERACTVCTYKETRDIPATGGGSGGGSSRPSGGGSSGGGTGAPVAPVEPQRPDWNPFKDVREVDWFHNSVKFVYEKELMEGTSDTTFSPNINATRAMIVTLLWRLENSPAPTSKMDFPDVSEGQWYSDAVHWAVSAGVVKGYGDGNFGPEDTITREQLAAMLYRYAKAEATTGDLTAFSDSDRISEWAEEAVSWAVGQGILTGKGGGILDPIGTAFRAEVATMLMRYLAR